MWIKPNKNFSLIFGVIIVSILSILLIKQQVLAQWVAPGTTPGDSGPPNVLFNPVQSNLDLGGFTIIDTVFGTKNGVIDISTGVPDGKAAFYGAANSNAGSTGVYGEGYYGIYGQDKAVAGSYAGYFNGDVNVTGSICFGAVDCVSSWTTVSGLWQQSGSDIYYSAGNVGIGQAPGAYDLDVFNSTGGSLRVAGQDPDVYLERTSASNQFAFRLATNYESGYGSGGEAIVAIDSDSSPTVGSWASFRRNFQIDSAGNVGIGTRFDPKKPLHIHRASSNAEIAISTGNGNDTSADYWSIYNDNNQDLRFWSQASDNILTLEKDGDVGIGTINPYSNLMIEATKPGGATDLRLSNLDPESNSEIVFEEGTEGDNFKIFYNGSGYNGTTELGGWNNWLEFWGWTGLNGVGPQEPLLTIERDYSPADNNYGSVGIGIPRATHFAAKLGVQNYGTEDILNLFDNGVQVVNVTDSGKTIFANDSSAIVPMGRLHVDESAGIGIYVKASLPVYAIASPAGGTAGFFQGDVFITNQLDGSESYLQIDTIAGAPAASECTSSAQSGKMILDDTNNALYICTALGWRSVAL